MTTGKLQTLYCGSLLLNHDRSRRMLHRANVPHIVTADHPCALKFLFPEAAEVISSSANHIASYVPPECAFHVNE